MKVIIEVRNDNALNAGWLEYLLGLPEPNVEASPDEHDGYVMAAETRDLRPIRKVFAEGIGGNESPYVVKVIEAVEPVEAKPLITVTGE